MRADGFNWSRSWLWRWCLDVQWWQHFDTIYLYIFFIFFYFGALESDGWRCSIVQFRLGIGENLLFLYLKFLHGGVLFLSCRRRWRRKAKRTEQKMEGDPSLPSHKPVHGAGQHHWYVLESLPSFMPFPRRWLRLLTRLCFLCRKGLCRHLWEAAHWSASLSSLLRNQVETPSVHPAAGRDGTNSWMPHRIVVFALYWLVPRSVCALASRMLEFLRD